MMQHLILVQAKNMLMSPLIRHCFKKRPTCVELDIQSGDCSAAWQICWLEVVLRRLVEKYGEGQWSLISTFFPGRIGKQCRERWHHQLNPKINRNAWSVEEERIIVAAHKVEIGLHWIVGADVSRVLE